MNKVILMGRLCHEPELKYIGENTPPVTNFALAISRNYKNSQGNYDTDFINCELWDKKAEIFCQYITKGQLVSVEGKLKVNKYISSSGENKIKIIVKVDEFNFVGSKFKNNNAENTYNRDAIFDNEEVFESEISESDIPF